jgi:hypothetical protein
MGWVVGWNVIVVRETPALLVLATTTRHYVKDVPENTLTAMNLLESLFSECSTTAVVRPGWLPKPRFGPLSNNYWTMSGRIVRFANPISGEPLSTIEVRKPAPLERGDWADDDH